MAKRVLLAEASDTIRGVAATILRQNGFEVISVGATQKALEVLNHTKPNLIIVGSHLCDKGGSLFHERISGDGRFTATPMILLADPGQPDPEFPEEAVIKLPFEPKEFLERVSGFISAPVPDDLTAVSNPLHGTGLEEAAIDAALGLDQIEVTGSEVMDKTTIGKKSKSKVIDKMIGYDHTENTDTGMSDSPRVGSIIIQDESGDIKPNADASHRSVDTNASGTLDILSESDQYGMANSEDHSGPPEDANHDYDWFINEMQREAQVPADSGSADNPHDSGSLTVTDNASIVDPITPPPASLSDVTPTLSGDGVEKFIDEFKKEVDKIHDAEPESVVVEADHSPGNVASDDRGWEDSLEMITPEQINLFKREFSTLLAEKIARKIVDKIDSRKLMTMLKNEILAQQTKKSQDHS